MVISRDLFPNACVARTLNGQQTSQHVMTTTLLYSWLAGRKVQHVMTTTLLYSWLAGRKVQHVMTTTLLYSWLACRKVQHQEGEAR